MHRRIDIAEVPLVGGNLPIGVGIETAQHQQQLLLGEIKIHQRQGDRVEGQVPGRIPRVLPLVRHGDHIGVEHVKPFRIPPTVAAGFHERMTLVLLQPLIQIEVVELLAPEHSRQRLAVHPPFIFTQRSRRDPFIELIGIGAPAFEDLVETAEGISYLGGRQTQADGLAAAAGNVERIVGRSFGPGLGGIHRLAAFPR